ncbi:MULTISPECIES: peroxiredoxin [unclassified Wenzhouxiangella]|uniref:peroxiredoxin n=1 Tax=unclassified Wenzhouxiangella TaxID=2613841 RepID=UPI000E32D2EC|nr:MULTISPECIES: peroxiredoxin [unclassified Wenzhouxiangella]RFF28652.1 peroxiredoxin [Wenzhouxiangella sp. 15181]RFP68966.1 peroxiredoxin [Wenzhouxiangella sp. 15190]
MTVSVGDRVPEATLTVMTPQGPSGQSTTTMFGAGTTVLFAVPGAFTPTCSTRHLPGFVERAGEIRNAGADRIVCMAVNDVFVMDAWGKSAGVGDTIVMAADGNGEFTRALGLEMDSTGFGMGKRCQRFAMIINDGVIKHLMIERPGEFRVSNADNVLEKLRASG